MGYFLQQSGLLSNHAHAICRRSPELSRARRSEEGAAEPEPEGEPEPEDDYYCVKKSLSGTTLKSCLPKVSLDGRPTFPAVCSISCQHIISRSPNRGQIECLNIPPQAVADPLKMACSMLPGVGDVCVCQDQVTALSTKSNQLCPIQILVTLLNLHSFIQDLCNGSVQTAASSLLATLLLLVVAQIFA